MPDAPIDFVHSVSGNTRYLDAENDGLTPGTAWVVRRKAVLELDGQNVSAGNPLPIKPVLTPLLTIAIDQTGSGDRTLLTPTIGKAIALYALSVTFSVEVAEVSLRSGASAAFAKLLKLVSFSISDETYPITLGIDAPLIMNVGGTSIRSTGFLRYVEV